MDQEAKHYRSMKNAVWLFLYLVLNANRRTGFLIRKVKTICSDMGINRDAVLRWLNILRRQGYITTQNTGRCLHIQIKKWKALPGVGKPLHQEREIFNPRVGGNPTSQQTFQSPNPVHFGQKTPDLCGPNDITIKKDILKNDIESNNSFDSNLNTSKQFIPKNKEQLLALDLPEDLNDRQGLALYLSYCKRYPESLLRKVLGEVKEMPSEKVKKSRAALFNHLIQQYDQKDSQDLSN